MTLNKFLETLFAEGEHTCFTPLANGTSVKLHPSPYDTFFCINALHPTQDLNPEREFHRPDRPRRADCNVVCFRNFLIELDSMALEAQIAYVTDRVPVTSITYSGGKSYHFIISLETPLETLSEYKNIAARLHALLPAADKSCKNPSRLSRLPFAMRKDTEKEQTLVQLNSRISLQTLESVLPLVEVKNFSNKIDNEEDKSNYKNFISADINDGVEAPDAIMDKFNWGRNDFFHWLGKRIVEFEIPEESRYRLIDKAYNNLNSTKDFDIEEAYAAARLK